MEKVINTFKVEKWDDKEIRFIFLDGKWQAVAKDVALALGYVNKNEAINLHCKGVANIYPLSTKGGVQKFRVITEKEIYRLIMRSNLLEAEQFQDWIYDLIKSLRQEVGLEAYQAFSLLDKEYQKDCMAKIKLIKENPSPFDYMNINKWTNEAIANIYDLGKKIKKADLTIEQKQTRQSVLNVATSIFDFKVNYDPSINVRNTILGLVNKGEVQ